jgi:hypothetical protein
MRRTLPIVRQLAGCQSRWLQRSCTGSGRAYQHSQARQNAAQTPLSGELVPDNALALRSRRLLTRTHVTWRLLYPSSPQLAGGYLAAFARPVRLKRSAPLQQGSAAALRARAGLGCAVPRPSGAACAPLLPAAVWRCPLCGADSRRPRLVRVVAHRWVCVRARCVALHG